MTRGMATGEGVRLRVSANVGAGITRGMVTGEGVRLIGASGTSNSAQETSNVLAELGSSKRNLRLA